MRKTASMGLSVVILTWAACIQAAPFSASSSPVCSDMLTSSIPARADKAPEGSTFVRTLTGLSDDEREDALVEQLLAGNIPEFLRHLTPVHLAGTTGTGEAAEVTLCVSPDYVAIGSNRDFFLAPMRLRSALTVAQRFGFALPTPRIADAIYAQAALHLQPQPLPASDTMRTTAYYWEHNELVNRQRAGFATGLGALTAGDKKDLVLTNRLWNNLDRVAIYGWHRLDGSPIQPLSTVHGAHYADYSHGVRLVSDTAYVGGRAVSLLALLQNTDLAGVLSDEGRIRNPAALIHALTTRLPAARAVQVAYRSSR